MKKHGVLWKTKCYLAGNLEYDSSSFALDWREKFNKEARKMGVITLSPTDNPLINYPKEDNKFRDILKDALKNGDYRWVHEKMKEIRSKDLCCIDYSAFVVAVINTKIPTVGAVDEIIVAKRQNKPVFLVVDGGYAKLPLWWCSYFTYDWVFSNLDSVINTLKSINRGELGLDNKYWRLLDYKYR